MAQKKLIQPANNRREFLGKLTGAAALVGVSSLVNPAKAEKTTTPFIFDADDPDAWFGSLKGKHRAVFDCTEPKEIFPFAWPKIFVMTNTMSGAAPSDVSAVVVLRHAAFAYALTDDMWAKYKLGELIKANDPETKAPALRNPFWKPKPDDFKVPGLGAVTLGIPELQGMNIQFCACGMAILVYSAAVADAMKMDAATVKKEWLDHLIPGIPAMPSGVWAVGRAQEHGCGYIYV